ncbi:dipicolinate synthase subunit DpsA [Hydrogenoanaerobacterium sp.]|uniref:dipicolinate synthase subunit DpsA n=1 Tax=Hydrogenoanaerobacterium sp. TaxID=2953763 RepID=UPI00289A50CF|nr:dipicolinate synthase subunit DpsA [Hydrogenoanaerobacterium sp.]
MLHDKALQITVIGGDLRQAHLANKLAQDGFAVSALCLEQDVYLGDGVQLAENAKKVIGASDVIILPLPVTADKVTVNAPFSEHKLTVREVLTSAKKGALLLGGMIDTDLQTKGEQMGLTLIDYLEREELAVLNAVPTSEGALAIAMRERASTIYGSTCIITGYGRISKVLARILIVMGARVIVAARKHSDLAWVKIIGCEAIPISKIKDYVGEADILFNTVPAMILDEEILSGLKHDCLVIDLASKPGGVDFDMAKNLQIKTIWALSLPGKVAPISAGEIIKETVLNILAERGIYIGSD